MRKFLFKNKKNGYVYYVDADLLLKGELNIVGDRKSFNDISGIPYKDVITTLSRKDFEAVKDGSIDLSRLLSLVHYASAFSLNLKVIEGEKDMLMKMWNGVQLSREDVDYLFEHYSGDIKDCSIVWNIFTDYEDLAENYANDFSLTDILREHIDLHGLGKDLVESHDEYIKLPSGTIVEVIYY